jgi:hypothetical protein
MAEQEISVNLGEVAMAAAITVSVAGVSYAVLNTDGITGSTKAVADRASCHAIDVAVVAFTAQHDAVPTTIEQVRPYVKGDLSGYRIVAGRPAGPGC